MMRDCPTNEQLSQFLVGGLSAEQIDTMAEHVENCLRCQEIVDTLDDASDTIVSQMRAEASISAPAVAPECQRMLAQAEVLLDIPVATDDAAALGRVRDYRLLAKLGEGGMGAVYKALHVNLKRVVALKVLPTDRMRNQQAVSRFYREMEAVGKLHHPNIVHATDAGEDRGTHYLVMEHIEGMDLSELARRIGPLPIADACELVRQAAVGLQHAYDHGLVHRDIKPSNLMLSTVGRMPRPSVRESDEASNLQKKMSGHAPPMVKILDLGLARLAESPEEHLTSTGQTMGTLDYMAPEQGGDSHEVDIRADIYSLGATLYKLLCGQAPFGAAKYNTPVKKLTALATAPIPSIRERRTDLPDELVELLDRMLAKDPNGRLTPPSEVVAALQPFAAGADLTRLLERASSNEVAEETVVAPTQSTDHHLSSAMTGTHVDAPASDVPETISQPLHVADRNKSNDLVDASSQPAGSTTEWSQSRPSPAQATQDSGRTNRFLSIAAALGGIILLGAITLFFQSKDGTIVVEIDDPEGLVQVTVDGEDIVITDKNAGDPIRLQPGDHTLNVTRAGLEFTTDSFTLKRRGKVVLNVKLVEGEVRVIQKGDTDTDTVLGQHTIDKAATQTVVASTTWQPGPAEDVLPGLVPRPAKFDGIKRWQIETQQTRARLSCIDVSPDGKFAAVGDDAGTIRLYDASSLQLVRVFCGHTNLVTDLKWSPDGAQLASGSADGTVRIWERDGRTTRLLIRQGTFGPNRYQYGKGVEGIDWHADGQQIAATYTYDGISIWNTITGQLLHHLGKDREYRRLAWNLQGEKLAAVDLSGQLAIWDTNGAELFHGKVCGPGTTTAICWSADGKRIVTNGERSIPALFSDDGKLLSSLPLQEKPNPPAIRIVRSPDGTRFITVHYGPLRVWNEDGTLDRELKLQNSDYRGIGGAAWLPDGQSLICIRSGNAIQELIQLDLSDSVKTRKQGYHSRFASGDFDADGATFVLGGINQKYWRCAFPSGEVNSIGNIPGQLHTTWSPDGARIAVVNEGAAYLIDAEQNDPLKVGEFSYKDRPALAWNHAGTQFVTVGNTTTAEIWNADGTVANKIDLQLPTFSASWSPDDRELVFACGQKTLIHNVTGELVREIDSPNLHSIESVAWHPKDDWIALDCNGHIQLVTPQGKAGPIWEFHKQYQTRINWSPDGQWLSAIQTDSSVRLFDHLGNPGPVLDLEHTLMGGVFSAWSHDSRYILTLGNYHQPTVWDVVNQEPVVLLTILSDDHNVAFNPAGQITHGEPWLIEQSLVVIVENEDGSLDLLKPSEFEERIGQSLYIVDPNRRAAEWALAVGGVVEVKTDKVERARIETAADLPDEPFQLVAAWLQGTQISDDDLERLQGVNALDTVDVQGTKITGSGLSHLKSMRLDWLRLGGSQVTDVELSQVLPSLTFRSLELENTKIGDPTLTLLKNLEQLWMLKLNGTQITDDGLQQLSKVSISNLTLHDTKISDEGLSHLEHIHSLVDLHIYRTQVTEASVTALSKALPDCRIEWDGGVIEPTKSADRRAAEWVISNGGYVGNQRRRFKKQEDLPSSPLNLTEVYLDSTNVTDEDFVHLADMTSLSTLSIQKTSLDGSGFKHLKASTRLFELQFAFSSVDDDAIHALPDCRLSHLDLSGTPTTDSTIKELRRFESLSFLALGAEMTDDGLKQLTAFPNLSHLHCGNNQRLTDDGMVHVAKLTELTMFSIMGCNITDDGLDRLISLKKLELLEARNSKVTEAGVTALSKALPNCRIRWDGGVIEPTKSADRRASEWVIANGGYVSNSKGRYKSVAELPDQPFKISAVFLDSTNVSDDGFANLSGLTDLVALHLQSTSLDGSGFTHLKSSTRLQYLFFAFRK